MAGNCGIANPDNPCRCTRRIGVAVNSGRVDPQHLLFAGHPSRRRVRQGVAEMERLDAAAAIFRSHPDFAAPERVATEISRLLDADAIPSLVGDGDGDRGP